MSVAQGYGKIATSGSVFIYDTGDTVNCYRGEPTTNIAYNQFPTLNANSNWWTNSGTGSFSDNDLSVAKPIIPNINTDDLVVFSAQTIGVVSNLQLGSAQIAISPSTQYAFSIWYTYNGSSAPTYGPYVRTVVNNNNICSFTYNGNSNASTWPRNQWIRLTASCVTQANETGIYMSSYIGNHVGEKVCYFGYQVESKSHSTPFVKGTRSSTQALLPLVSSHSLDVSNMSFDSSSNIYFNSGLGNQLYAGVGTDYPHPYHTFEAVFKTPGTGSTMSSSGVIGLDYGRTVWINGMGDLIYHLYSGSYIVNGGVSQNLYDNRYHHVVCLRSTASYEMYIDGVLKATGNPGDLAWNGLNEYSSMIARFGNNPNDNIYKFNGEIPVIKIYGRALTFGEVKQNFNHYKSRYNII